MRQTVVYKKLWHDACDLAAMFEDGIRQGPHQPRFDASVNHTNTHSRQYPAEILRGDIKRRTYPSVRSALNANGCESIRHELQAVASFLRFFGLMQFGALPAGCSQTVVHHWRPTEENGGGSRSFVFSRYLKNSVNRL